MDSQKRRRLEAKGWKVGTVAEFLGLSNAEERFIEIKLALSGAFGELRRELRYTQAEVAQLLGSSQSRVAKMEGGDRSVSLDLLTRGLLALGSTREDIACVVGQAPRRAKKKTASKRRRKAQC